MFICDNEMYTGEYKLLNVFMPNDYLEKFSLLIFIKNWKKKEGYKEY